MAKRTNIVPLLAIIIATLIIIIIILWFGRSSNQVPITRYDSLSPRLEPTPLNIPVQIVQDSKDTLRNPYAPPIRYYDDTYRQLGYLSNHERKLILFGKPAHYRRDKWYYYTMVDDIKMPIEVNKRKCTSQQGCDSVSTKDMVVVDGKEYMVNMYDTDI
jgi:hypothetical protein